MKLANKKIKKLLIIDTIVCICIGILGYISITHYLSSSWKDVAMPYLSENEEIISEIGITKKLKYKGMKENAEEDGRPVYFEVTTDRGEFFVILWMDAIQTNPNKFIVTKHIVKNVIVEKA